MSLFPNYVLQFFDNSDPAQPLSGGLLFFYEPGGTTKKNTTDGTGGATNPNPIILDSAGRPDNSGTAIDICLTDGETYKIVLAPSTDSDPPTNPIRTTDNLVDLAGSGQWVNTKTPTYANATQFTLVGNQTANYTVGRRVKTTGGADRYSRISVSAYADPTTTITVVDTRDSSGAEQSLHASMTSAATHITTPDGVRGAMIIDGMADAGGTVDAITATFYPAIVLADRTTVLVRALGINATTTPTFAPDGETAKTIVKNNNVALTASDITGADHVIILQYNSTNDNWTMLNPGVVVPATTSTVITSSTTFTASKTGDHAITIVGGGGGGGGGNGSYFQISGAGGGGGGFADSITIVQSLTIDTNYTVIIGAGGAGGAGGIGISSGASGDGSNGSAGGSTTFDSTTVSGGAAGAADAGNYPGGANGDSGDTGSPVSPLGLGGAGGAGGSGNGAVGSIGSGYGSGGGGGAGGAGAAGDPDGGAGGAGAPGYCLVIVGA